MVLEPNTDEEILEMEKQIKKLVGGPIVHGQNGFTDGDIYMARSWLIRIHTHLRREQGDTEHAARPSRDHHELLAGVANRLGLDYVELLEAEPREEVRMIYDALEDCEQYGYEPPA